MNPRGKQEIIDFKGILNETGKRRCDCDETGYFISFILFGVLNYKGSYKAVLTVNVLTVLFFRRKILQEF